MDAKPGQQCGEVRMSMNMQLQSWYEEGFILPGWQLEWWTRTRGAGRRGSTCATTTTPTG